MNRFSDLYRVSHGMNVHIHNPWRFMQHVVVQSRWVDSAFFKFRHDRRHFVFGEHQVTHHHGHIASLLESHPRTKRERRL